MAYQKNFTGIPFKTLLDKGHKQYGLAGVNTEILQFPAKENGMMAIFRAVVENADGQTYSGHGDADPNNTTSAIAPHLLRMAETRAIARALRWLTNSGETAHVEISGDEDESDRLVDGDPGPSSQQPPEERIIVPELDQVFSNNASEEPAKRSDEKIKHEEKVAKKYLNHVAIPEVFLNHASKVVADIGDEDQVAIVLTSCGFGGLDDVPADDYRRVYDALKAKRTELEEKRAATKLAAN